MEIKKIVLEKPEDTNIIIGQAHFIKTAEDLYEALVNSVPQIRFGIGFCESSGPCLVRGEGTDDELKKVAQGNALRIGAGHLFVIIIEGAYPINVLRAIKDVPEVCTIFCATANSVQALVAETDEGRAFLGVVDGYAPKGIEKEEDKKARKEFLRKIGYKL